MFSNLVTAAYIYNWYCHIVAMCIATVLAAGAKEKRASRVRPTRVFHLYFHHLIACSVVALPGGGEKKP